MRVLNVREEGTERDAHWVTIPPPDVVRFRGLARLGSYIRRVASSPTSFASLVASTPDGGAAVSVWKLKGQMSVNVSFKIPEDAAIERRVRALVDERGYSLLEDYLANGGAIRSIRIEVPCDAMVVTGFAHRFLHEVRGVRRLAPMHYGFEEREDA